MGCAKCDEMGKYLPLLRTLQQREEERAALFLKWNTPWNEQALRPVEHPDVDSLMAYYRIKDTHHLHEILHKHYGYQ